MKKFRNVALALVILLASGIILVCAVFNYCLAPVSKDDTIKKIEIEAGTSVADIAGLLKEENLIRSKNSFQIYTFLTNNRNLQAGTYDLSENMGVRTIVEVLSGGKISKDSDASITFKEGINMREVVRLISEKTDNSEDDIYALLDDGEYLDTLIGEYWFLTDDIKDSRIYYSLEGYLYPDTYTFAKDDDIRDIFKVMLDNTSDKLSDYQDEIENSDMSVHELMTLASIVELESPSSEDRPTVAGVFFNRLADDISLGSDVTTYYGIKINMADRDLYQSEINECNDYNTRCTTFKGLPVGPVSNVSVSSLEAVLNPNSNGYYYFVADKNGKTYFSETYQEHLSTIEELKSDDLYYEY